MEVNGIKWERKGVKGGGGEVGKRSGEQEDGFPGRTTEARK